MRIGALIVAAGKSSRMRDFKPMMNIGSITIAQRVVNNFRQAGITRIVVITGFNADVLEQHLASRNVTFLRNDNYATTQMFDSVCIGLNYLKDKVDTVLFTPIDVPLFTAKTVTSLINEDKPLVTPVFNGHCGHPILIRSSLIDIITAYRGNGGLRGAMEVSGEPMTYIEVDDPGIVHDADTPSDYQKLLDLHNKSLIRTQIQVSLAKEKEFFDEQMLCLLAMIKETGSVRDACGRMHISYSTGWNRIRNLESQLKKPVIRRTQGGPAGSHSELTSYGEEIIRRYQQLASAVRSYANKAYDEIFRSFFLDE